MTVGTVRHAARAFPALLRVGLAEMVAYRAELLIWILTATSPLIMLFVWDTVAAGGAIGRFDQPAFAAYFTATLVVRQLTSAWVAWELNESIRTGSLSPQLLKPLHPLVFRAAENIAALPFRVLVLLPLVGLIWAWRPTMRWAMAPSHVPLLVLSIVLAWFINYLVQVCFGALAFYLQQSLGLFGVWFGLWVLLSGYVFPLELMPPALAQVVRWLPFPATLGIPVEIAVGLRTGNAAWQGLALQAAWALVFVFVAARTWRGGVRRYEAFGA